MTTDDEKGITEMNPKPHDAGSAKTLSCRRGWHWSAHCRPGGGAGAILPLTRTPGVVASVLVFVGLAAAGFTAFRAAPAAAQADPCPNAEFRTGPSAKLPDCRAYEQASPVDKNGGDVMGNTDHVKASLAGDAVVFYSQVGIPGGTGAQDFPLFLARRGEGSWSTAGLFPPARFGQGATVVGWTDDLSYSFSRANDVFAGAGQTLLSHTWPGNLIETIVPPTLGLSALFAAASDDGSNILFQSSGAPLTPDAVAGEDNLYLWDRTTGELSLVGVLPESACGTPPCVPPGGSFAGPYDWWGGTTAATLGRGGIRSSYYTQEERVIADDGSAAFFTAGDTGQIYVRRGLDGATPLRTDRVSASQKTNGLGPGGTDPNGPLPAAFVAATPDGSQAFFTSREELTNDANTGPEPGISRANLDGSDPELGFLPAIGAGVAIDAAHIYWANQEGDAIGRANLDGSDPDPAFITGADNPTDVAVDGSHVYWTNAADGTNGTGSIGRADLDGQNANQSFITGANNPQGIAVDDSFIYWTNQGTTVATRRIGRASLDGSGVNQSFISVSIAGNPGDVTVDGSFIYYTRPASGAIGRANLDGTNNLQTFITGTSSPQGVAVDGSHVYWSNSGTGTIGRANLDGTDPDQSFIESAPGADDVEVNATHIHWLAASSSPQGNDLYRYDVGSGELTNLTPDHDDPNGAQVQGVVGISDDGSRVYFAANGDLDGAGPATVGDCEGDDGGNGFFGFSGECNLYLWDQGVISFVARLDVSGGVFESDAANWQPNSRTQPMRRVRTGRVSPDGSALLFRSKRQLTAYDNQGVPQLYRYDASRNSVSCVSCNPSGDPPVDAPALQSIDTFAKLATRPVVQTRNLSSDGESVFFESSDPLLPSDTNGVLDVYQWQAEGTGSCETANADGGCLYLLSTGKDANPSFFADASASGDDVFIFTREQLVPADRDGLQDVYDASVGGGLAEQHEVAPPPCQGDACQDSPSPRPEAGMPGSAAFSGTGNRSAGRACAALERKAKRAGRAAERVRRKLRRARRAEAVRRAKRLARRARRASRRANQAKRAADRCNQRQLKEGN